MDSVESIGNCAICQLGIRMVNVTGQGKSGHDEFDTNCVVLLPCCARRVHLYCLSNHLQAWYSRERRVCAGCFQQYDEYLQTLVDDAIKRYKHFKRNDVITEFAYSGAVSELYFKKGITIIVRNKYSRDYLGEIVDNRLYYSQVKYNEHDIQWESNENIWLTF